MELNDYQQYAKTFAVGINDPEKALMEAVFGLTEEAGECAGKFKRIARGDSTVGAQTDAIVLELGDCLWYLSQLAERIGVPLDEVARRNLAKLEDRRTRGVIKGTGDNR